MRLSRALLPVADVLPAHTRLLVQVMPVVGAVLPEIFFGPGLDFQGARIREHGTRDISAGAVTRACPEREL